MCDRPSQAAGAKKKKRKKNSVGGGNKSVQELECIALKGDISTVVQRLGGARDFGRVEFLVLVRRERCIHVCDKCGDRQGIRGGIRRTEEVGNRVACEVKPVRGRTQVSIPWGLVIGCVGVLDCIGIFCGVHFLTIGTELIDITRLVTRRRCGASAVSHAPHYLGLCLFLISNHTFAPVLLPWVRTERAILAKLNPLAAQFAEHTMGLYL